MDKYCKSLIAILTIFMFVFISVSSIASTIYIKNNEKTNFQKCSDPEIINMLNMSIVQNYLEEIVGFGPRPTGSENCSRTAEYLYSEFEKMGLDVKYDQWKYPLRQGKNVIATLNGTNNPTNGIFIVCAHYDTHVDSPGADDDGSGVAAMLSVAKIMSQFSFNNSVRFIAFSGHEIGPLFAYGSNAYVKEAYSRKENILGALMLDGFGNTTETGNVLDMAQTTRKKGISSTIMETAEKYSEYINIVIEPIPNAAGDSQSFVDYGYDSVTFFTICSDTPNHSPGDDLTHINYPFLTNATKLILASTIELAKKPIDLQVRITSPKEGYLYFLKYPSLKLPGLNIRKSGLRGMTYAIGGINIEINITTDEEIHIVYYSIDDVLKYIQTESPYNWKLKRFSLLPYSLSGRHKIGVTVTTLSGNIAEDQMEVVII